VDLQANAGGFGYFTDGGGEGVGGAVGRVEPFATPKVSFPISAGLGAMGLGDDALGGFATRVGFRHRADPNLAGGFGGGPTVTFADGDHEFGGMVDLELVPGIQTPKFGFSFAIRPTFVVIDGSLWSFHQLFEPAIAIPIGKSSVVASVFGGPFVAVYVDPEFGGHFEGGFLGASIGLHRRF
jgi:hypothetical protein